MFKSLTTPGAKQKLLSSQLVCLLPVGILNPFVCKLRVVSYFIFEWKYMESAREGRAATKRRRKHERRKLSFFCLPPPLPQYLPLWTINFHYFTLSLAAHGSDERLTTARGLCCLNYLLVPTSSSAINSVRETKPYLIYKFSVLWCYTAETSKK